MTLSREENLIQGFINYKIKNFPDADSFDNEQLMAVASYVIAHKRGMLEVMSHTYWDCGAKNFQHYLKEKIAENTK